MALQAIYFESALRSEETGRDCQIQFLDKSASGNTADILLEDAEGKVSELRGVMAYEVVEPGKVPEVNGPHVLYRNVDESGGTPGAAQEAFDTASASSTSDVQELNNEGDPIGGGGTQASDGSEPVAAATKL